MRIIKLAIKYNISTNTLIDTLNEINKEGDYTKMTKLDENEISIIDRIFDEDRKNKEKSQDIILKEIPKRKSPHFFAFDYFRRESGNFHFTNFELNKFPELVDEYNKLSDEISNYEKQHQKTLEIKESGYELYINDIDIDIDIDIEFDVVEFNKLLGFDFIKEDVFEKPAKKTEISPLQLIVDKKKEVIKLEYLFTSKTIFSKNHIEFSGQKFDIKSIMSKKELLHVHLDNDEKWMKHEVSSFRKELYNDDFPENDIHDNHFAPNLYCSSCQENPCMCSDAEKTSSTWID